jgi:hypothetical protein
VEIGRYTKGNLIHRRELRFTTAALLQKNSKPIWAGMAIGGGVGLAQKGQAALAVLGPAPQ